jgi:Protein of unknown function (DUF1559)
MRKSFVLLAAFVVGLTAAVVAAPVPKGGEAKLPPPTGAELRKSKNNMKMIMLAMHNYHDVTGAFPTNVVDGNGKAILSWRVHLLPYLEQDALYKKFKLDEGWDSANNKKLIEEIPDIYAPIRVKTKNKGETFYCGFAGETAVFEPGVRLTLVGVTDGTSNTIGVAEAGEPVFWTKPDDIPYDASKPLPKLGGQFDGDFYIALCDGSVQFVYSSDWNPDEFRMALTRAGGEIFQMEKAFGTGAKKK